METSKTTIKKWGKVLAPIILGAVASTFRLSITEPIEFSEKAEQYLEKGATITVRLDKSVELNRFYHDEWYPAVSELSPLIDKAQKHISAIQTGQQPPQLDNIVIEQKIEELGLLRMKSSTYFFEDQTNTEFVKAISNVTKDFIDLLTELGNLMVGYKELDPSTRINKLNLLEKSTSNIANNIQYVSELRKRISPVQEFDKDRLAHYLDLHSRFRFGAIISRYLYLFISLLCIWILLVILFPNISLNPKPKKVLRKS